VDASRGEGGGANACSDCLNAGVWRGSATPESHLNVERGGFRFPTFCRLLRGPFTIESRSPQRCAPEYANSRGN